MNRSNLLERVNYVAKALLALLLIHAVVFPDLPQYQGKGIGWRLLLYPISGLLVPIIFLFVKRRLSSYPHLIDLLVLLPFLIDTAGNTANLYDTVNWWDDVMHFVTWVPWVAAFGLAVHLNKRLGRWNVALLTAGFGAITHIIWELLEYVAFIQANPNEFNTAYQDTMGDLALSLCGSFFGALLVATLLWRVHTVTVKAASRR
jgi:hypothetical protein